MGQSIEVGDVVYSLINVRKGQYLRVISFSGFPKGDNPEETASGHFYFETLSGLRDNIGKFGYNCLVVLDVDL